MGFLASKEDHPGELKSFASYREEKRPAHLVYRRLDIITLRAETRDPVQDLRGLETPAKAGGIEPDRRSRTRLFPDRAGNA